MMSLTTAPNVALIQVEQYLDPYYGQWLISSAPPPIPFWQATSPSYKGGTATVTAMSRDELMTKMNEFIKTHDRLIATDAVASALQTPSIAVALFGGAWYAFGKYKQDETFEKVGMVGGAIGVAGILGALAIRYQAARNRDAQKK